MDGEGGNTDRADERAEGEGANAEPAEDERAGDGRAEDEGAEDEGAEDEGAARRRWPLYVAAAIGAVLALAALGAATGGVAVNDPDVWWVAAAGRASAWPPLDANHFSFTAPDAPWVFHEWLAGPAYAAGLEGLGARFLAWVALAGLLLQGALVLFAALRGPAGGALSPEPSPERSPEPSASTEERAAVADPARLRAAGLLLAGGWALSVGLHGMSARVTVWVRALPLGLVLLAFGPRFDLRRALGCLALILLWANLHGSFPLAFVLLGAAGLEGHARARWGTALAGFGLSFLTPHGAALHGLVLDYVLGRSETLAVVHQYVREFQPPWAHLDGLVAAGLVVFALVVLLAASALRRWPGRAAVVLVLAVLALRHQRHLPLVVLLAVPLLRPALAARLPPLRLPAPPRTLAALAAGPAVALGLAAAVFARPPATGLGGLGFEELAAALPRSARVFVPMRYGGRLIWLRGEDGVRPFYDPRNDCYPADVAREAFELGRPGQAARYVREVLARRGASHALVPEGSPVDEALRDRWTELGRGGGWVLHAAHAVAEGAPPASAGPVARRARGDTRRMERPVAGTVARPAARRR
ncbi:MAG: hypothetical protein CMH59_00100 [Myxococcales bacterium]|nr:hypothetical protein [Myxococcales bacterium]